MTNNKGILYKFNKKLNILVQQVHPDIGEHGEPGSKCRGGIVGKGHLLHGRQLGVAGPHALVGRAQSLEDAVQLIQLRLAREQRLHRQELCEYTAHRPHVHWCRVFL